MDNQTTRRSGVGAEQHRNDSPQGPATPWRQQLHRLEPLDLPLLPCGAGAEGKGPIDPKTGKGLSGWTTARFNPPQILRMNGVVRSVGTRTGDGVLCHDLDGGTALELALAHGCDPQQAQTWQVHRDTDPLRLKVLWRLSAEQQAELGEISAKAHTAPPADGRKGEALEVFHSPGRQVLLIGEHVPSGGSYVWPDGMGPEALAPIPPAWWELTKRIAAGELGMPSTASSTAGKAKGSSAKGEWRPADPCPICGRRSGKDRPSSYCSRNRSSGTIRCFHGNTFSPELTHGVLKLGDRITGTDGTVYGWCGAEAQGNGDVFSTFRIHQEREPRNDSQAELRDEADRQQEAGPAHPGEPGKPQGELNHQPKRRTLAPDEVLFLLPLEIGTPRLNVRTGDVHTEKRGILSGNQIGRLYLELSSAVQRWPKEATTDAVMLLASRNQFDPVKEWLEAIEAEPLPMDQWERLDRHLLGIDDPIAARFLPRFLISAIARTMEPGCSYRETPVLIGPEKIGKTETGRLLFGADQWVEGVGRLDRDALQRVRKAWGVELAELNGITRRADQEALKAFLTERIDTYRAPYDRTPESHARRFVFWGTSNQPPLRDSTANTRYVCIPLPDRMLPLDWVKEHRGAIWARALERYRAGVRWDRIDDEERAALADRNSEFREVDPWAEEVEKFLAERLAGTDRRGLPVTVPEVLKRLDIPTAQRNNETARRVARIAESLGWCQARRRWNGAPPKAGLWPAEQGGAVHPDQSAVHPACTPAETAPQQASSPAVHPDHPESRKVEREGGGRQQPPPPAGAAPAHAGEVLSHSGCTPPEHPQNACAADGFSESVGVHGRGARGVHAPAECAPAIQNAPAPLTVMPSAAVVDRLIDLRDRMPDATPAKLGALLATPSGVRISGGRVAAWLARIDSWDEESARLSPAVLRSDLEAAA